eukprot:COSAG03_NODE_700_length_6205_cov_3.689977_8_plen_22_part_01
MRDSELDASPFSLSLSLSLSLS